MTIEKVYDELYGMIDDLKKQIAAGSGTDVTITPALESGTKVADYEIDGESGIIYAPTPVDTYLKFGSQPVKVGEIGDSDLYSLKLSYDNVAITTQAGAIYQGAVNVTSDLPENVDKFWILFGDRYSVVDSVLYKRTIIAGGLAQDGDGSLNALVYTPTSIASTSLDLYILFTLKAPETVPDEDLTPETRTTKRAKK